MDGIPIAKVFANRAPPLRNPFTTGLSLKRFEAFCKHRLLTRANKEVVMGNLKMIFALIVASFLDLSVSRAQDCHDPSPHQIRFVTVQPGVKIETLNWGGTRRPLIFIAGAWGLAQDDETGVVLMHPPPRNLHALGILRVPVGGMRAALEVAAVGLKELG
jgi:hypothetical protein